MVYNRPLIKSIELKFIAFKLRVQVNFTILQDHQLLTLFPCSDDNLVLLVDSLHKRVQDLVHVVLC